MWVRWQGDEIFIASLPCSTQRVRLRGACSPRAKHMKAARTNLLTQVLYPLRGGEGIVFRLAFAVIGVIASLASAQTTAPSTQPALSASLGFANNFKPDNWTPIYARVTDADGPRPATLEVRSARGKLGHDIIARITTSPSPTTYTLYAPIGYLDRVVLQLRDDRGRLLRDADLSETIAATPAALGGPVIGVAGPSEDALRVSGQLVAATGEYVSSGALPPALLPDRAIGYADIDCLVLAAADLDVIENDVQQAIVAWVRAGGIVVVWPGAVAPTRLDAPLVAVLPAKIGTPASITYEGHELVGRELTDSTGGHPPLAIRKLGLGQVALLAFDPSRLPATKAVERIPFWRTITSGQLPMLPEERLAGVFDPLVTQAVAEQQLAPAPQASRRLPTSLIAVVLLAGLLIGPGELILLAVTRHHPRTWYTIAGLSLCCVGGLALVVAYAVKDSAVAASASAPKISVRVEVPDGLAASVVLSRAPDPAFDTLWLTADRTDPLAQPASTMTLAQRSDGFAIAGYGSISGPVAPFRGVRYSGETLHPAHIAFDAATLSVTNRTTEAWESVALINRDGVRISKRAMSPEASESFKEVPPATADNPSTKRIETGIERLAAEGGWEAILLDRRLSERLVRLLEVEPTATIVAVRSRAGSSFTLQVVR